MGHSAVRYLASDKNIHHGHDAEENGDTPPARSAIVYQRETCADPAMRERYSDWDENQAQDENDWDCDEDQQADVGIVHLPAEMRGQDEQPGAAGQRD